MKRKRTVFEAASACRSLLRLAGLITFCGIFTATLGNANPFVAKSSDTMLKKFNLSADVAIRPMGGSQPERYNAMMAGIIQAAPVTPPLDARGKKDGLNLIYNLKELNLPFIYSSVHTNAKTMKERPQLVQRFVAAIAESLYFAEKNPDKAKASLAKVLKINDSEILQSAYDAYAVSLVNRSMTVPIAALSDAIDVARETGTNVRKKPADLFDNSYVEQLSKSGFLKELWGSELR
jgi:ABC-type nitrate/sulfonate/bicarbonate transport system substrate-binding protein